ncbi:9286_t:CDS:2 [Cetraspora pellucida]|uniref:Sterol regulatory element-binding protein cleavage-activating protein n=1 Tax=Cetraspora pellucida TaxID=1433469 RepID=A0A9N9A569_9GLOM|nr:9286_t:CDS:2 [Cetraspora pellucida]
MTLFALFARIQIGSKVTAQLLYRHAIFCASHKTLVIVLAISVFLSLCYPAFDTYYLNSARDVSSSMSQVSGETFVEKYGTQPLFRVEQVIIKIANSKKHNKGGNVGVLDKDILLWTSSLQGRVMDTVITYSNQPSSLVTKKYSLSDLCLKPFDNNACLIHSPLAYWSNNADHLSSDISIPKTLSRINKTSSLGISIPLSSVFGNIVYEKGKIISADSIILTYFLKDMENDNEGQTTAIWEAIWQQIMSDTDATFRLNDDRTVRVNMSSQGELKHMSFNPDWNGSSARQGFLVLAYLIFPIVSTARLNSVSSKFGLVFSTVAHVFASLIMSLSICSLFGVTLTFDSISWKLLPFVFILIGVDNMITLTNAVTMIPKQLNVRERVAKGLEKVGYPITKMLISWLLLLMIFSAMNIDSIREFCIFTSIAMIIDFMLQMSFFIAVLSIDLERLELEICTYRVGNSDVNTDRDTMSLSKIANYGRRIGFSLMVLIFLVAVTNFYHTTIEFTNIDFTNIEWSSFKSALNSWIDNSVIFPGTRTNITYWETSMGETTDEFWSIVNMDKKDQFIEVLPARRLTLSFDIEQDYISRPLDGDGKWRLKIRAYIKTFVWFLKFIIFPIISAAFTVSVLMGFSLSEKTNNNEKNRKIATSSPSESSDLYVTAPQVITLRGRHLADVDLLCANLNGVIITSATDKHITSWNGSKGTPLKKLERYMRRCATCKCDSSGGEKNCISWPVRAMCMSEKIELAAAGFEDGVVRVWDINSGQVTYILKDTVEDVEQIMSAINNEKSVNERVTCLQIVASTSNSYCNTSEPLSDQKPFAMLLATYRNGYFREWDLTSGQISNTVFTNQKSGITYLFVIDDKDEIRIFTGARDGSVKCWVRKVYLNNEPNNGSREDMWKLLYTLPGEFGNAITSVSAKAIKIRKGCFGVVVTGAADGEVRAYDYTTGQYIETLSYGTLKKQKLAKERKEQLFFQQKQKKVSKEDWLEEYDDELESWDETGDFISHKDAIISIIIHPLQEESCPCGDIEETRGFSIITSSLDEKVNFWQLTRNSVDCTCVIPQLEETTFKICNNVDVPERLQKVFLGHVKQPGGSVIVLLKGHIIGVRRAENHDVSIKRSHGAEGEWEVWTLDINDPHVFEPTEEVDNLEDHDYVEFKVKTTSLVNEGDLIMEQKKKRDTFNQDRENVDKLKGFVRRRKTVSHLHDHNENHSHVHSEEENVQGQVMDFRQRSQKQRVYPDNSYNSRTTMSFNDEMNEMLPFAYIRQVVNVGENGIAVTYGNFVKVVLFKELES